MDGYHTKPTRARIDFVKMLTETHNNDNGQTLERKRNKKQTKRVTTTIFSKLDSID